MGQSKNLDDTIMTVRKREEKCPNGGAGKMRGPDMVARSDTFG